MKKLIALSFLLLSVSAFGQSILQRFDDPEKGHTSFIPKGCKSIGIVGGYTNFGVTGEKDGDGYAILSLLNIGNGSLHLYNVSPSFSYFVADDLSLGARLDYSGYTLDTNLKLDLRNLISDYSDIIDTFDDPDEAASFNNALNLQLSRRKMVHNDWGASFTVRKFLSFFGSKTFGIFGEARLYGNFGTTTSYPVSTTEEVKLNERRYSSSFKTGLILGGGAAIRLRDGSSIMMSIPIVGANYVYSKQIKDKTGNEAHLSSFRISRNSLTRDFNLMYVQVGYSRYIEPKKKH